MMRKLLLCCVLFSSVCIADSLTLQRWDTTSFSHLKQKYRQHAFLLVIWSLDCPACFKEFTALSRWKEQYPDSNLVLVSTDASEMQDDVIGVLNEYGLNNADVWIFSNENKATLRNSIDTNWFGELPRSYFINIQQKTFSHSGALTSNQLSQWQRIISTVKTLSQ
ncbi:MAG: hypothetical protein JKY51_01865 [Opitutaceae bacterium]|nr:hypothetical protein [Opitutaceae bacterium]